MYSKIFKDAFRCNRLLLKWKSAFLHQFLYNRFGEVVLKLKQKQKQKTKNKKLAFAREIHSLGITYKLILDSIRGRFIDVRCKLSANASLLLISKP